MGGAFFGELMFFGLTDGHRLDTVTAQKFCELVWITYGAFVKVLDNDTALRQRMHNFARLRLVVYQMVAAGADHTSPKTDTAHVKLMDSLEEAAQMIKEQGAPTG